MDVSLAVTNGLARRAEGEPKVHLTAAAGWPAASHKPGGRVLPGQLTGYGWSGTGRCWRLRGTPL